MGNSEKQALEILEDIIYNYIHSNFRVVTLNNVSPVTRPVFTYEEAQQTAKALTRLIGKEVMDIDLSTPKLPGGEA